MHERISAPQKNTHPFFFFQQNQIQCQVFRLFAAVANFSGTCEQISLGCCICRHGNAAMAVCFVPLHLVQGVYCIFVDLPEQSGVLILISALQNQVAGFNTWTELRFLIKCRKDFDIFRDKKACSFVFIYKICG